MELSSVYTIRVKVTNNFKSGSDVKIIVRHYHSPPTTTKPFTRRVLSKRKPSRTFDLQNTEEYLEILFNPKKKPSTYPYYITAGPMAMAKCEFTNDNDKSEPTPPDFPPFPEKPKPKDGFYPGGVWEVDENKKNKEWKLTIKEYQFDPQTDDVVIGPPPPGLKRPGTDDKEKIL